MNEENVDKFLTNKVSNHICSKRMCNGDMYCTTKLRWTI